jgi:phage-related protein
VEATLAQITSQRGTLADQIVAELNAAAFNGQTVDTTTANAQIASANQLLQQMHDLATNAGS